MYIDPANIVYRDNFEIDPRFLVRDGEKIEAIRTAGDFYGLHSHERITTLADVKKEEPVFSIEQLKELYKDSKRFSKKNERTKEFLSFLKRVSEYL